MSMVRLRRVGSRHEAYSGDRYLGDVDDSHLRDYVAQLPPAPPTKYSRSDGSRGEKGAMRVTLAEAVLARKQEILSAQPNMREDRAFVLASRQVLRESPGLARAYREDSDTVLG